MKDNREAYAALMKFYPLTVENLDGEEWRPIEGYDSYQISNYGRVKRFYHNGHVKIIKPMIGTNGYLTVNFSECGKSNRQSLHRLVAQLFIPRVDGKLEINHIDGCKLNNFSSNLEWTTRRENIRHAFDTGLAKSGEEHHNAKLKNCEVENIRNNPKGLSRSDLAIKYGVDPATISLIQLGRLYKDVGGCIRGKQEHPCRVPNNVREEIISLHRQGFSGNSLAGKFGLSMRTIWRIIHGRR